MLMDAHPFLIKPLDDRLTDFCSEEFGRVHRQAAELEVALKLHQDRIKEVCHSIKAHDHWVRYGGYFPFTLYCRLCGAAVSPEFDRRRHKGLCTRLALASSWV